MAFERQIGTVVAEAFEEINYAIESGEVERAQELYARATKFIYSCDRKSRLSWSMLGVGFGALLAIVGAGTLFSLTAAIISMTALYATSGVTPKWRTEISDLKIATERRFEWSMQE
jgi:hypothetical protein